jgi:hypothetical protein
MSFGRVRPPPYRKVDVDCAEVGDSKPHVTAHNLCGDLNRGDIPNNPMGQNPHGEPYPLSVYKKYYSVLSRFSILITRP